MLIITAVAAISAALAICYSVGTVTFFAMIGLSLMGVIYSIHLFPISLRHKIAYSKIKDIPGSRSLSESLAWAAIIIVLPLLEQYPPIWPAALVCIFIVLIISYVRSALFDILQARSISPWTWMSSTRPLHPAFHIPNPEDCQHATRFNSSRAWGCRS